jgi:cytochrome c-type biogenesis protein CcmE
MQEIHAAIRSMTNEELDQMALLATKMLEQGSITQDQAIEIVGIVIAHSIERKVNDLVTA